MRVAGDAQRLVQRRLVNGCSSQESMRMSTLWNESRVTFERRQQKFDRASVSRCFLLVIASANKVVHASSCYEKRH